MSDTFGCDDKDMLIGYLYDEIDPVHRRMVEDHLRICVACADELGALAGVRTGLAAWAPPQPDFGFTMPASRPAAEAGEIARPASWWADVPVWAQALAAVLVLAVSAGAANLRVHSGPDGLVVTTGWMAPPAVAPASARVSAEGAAQDWKPALTALETRLRDEIRATDERAPAAVRAAAPAAADEAAVRRVVQVLVEASEARQRRELAMRLTQFNRDMNVQRQADLVRFDQLLGQLDGRTGAEIARQRRLVNYLMRVSQPQQ